MGSVECSFRSMSAEELDGYADCLLAVIGLTTGDGGTLLARTYHRIRGFGCRHTVGPRTMLSSASPAMSRTQAYRRRSKMDQHKNTPQAHGCPSATDHDRAWPE